MGDVIRVPIRRLAVEIRGSVNRPGIYELLEEKTVQDLISLAGGTTVGLSHSVPIRLIRFIEGKKLIIDSKSTKTDEQMVRNGDVIVGP